MANFSGTMNLMGFKGARVFTNLDPQHPNQLFVAIPVAWNDIQLSQDGKKHLGYCHTVEKMNELLKRNNIDKKIKV